MGYISRDLIILDEMIQDDAKVELIDDLSKKSKSVILREDDPYNKTHYEVRIRGLSEDTMVLKPDYFQSPQGFFKGNKGECKRSDFVIISDNEKKQVIVFIEMKAKKDKSESIIQQLKGAKCLIDYCQKIGQLFWQEKGFLEDYQFYYVALTDLKLPKKPSRQGRNNPIHNYPDDFLKISGDKNIQFSRLISPYTDKIDNIK
ncbi:MAG: hypothetical protein AB4058_05210 [Microcystaceae cyanobacterium]